MAFVYDIVVREDQRRRGYGAAIMNAGALWCREHGHFALGLNVFAPQPRAPARSTTGWATRSPWTTAPSPSPMPADPRRTVDLNADLGEEVTDDAGLLAVVTTANVACGFHAGTPETMRVRLCGGGDGVGVVVGAQVSYRDRANFGRVAHDVPSHVLRDQVAEQVATLSGIALGEGTSVRYVKPHGALYHRVTTDPEQAGAVLAGSAGLPVLGFPGSRLLELAAAAGRASYDEGFPDRGYTDGRLVDRGEPGALLVRRRGDRGPGGRAGPRRRVAVRPRRLARRGRPRPRRTTGAGGRGLRARTVPGALTSPQAGPFPVEDRGVLVEDIGRSVDDTPSRGNSREMSAGSLLRGMLAGA